MENNIQNYPTRYIITYIPTRIYLNILLFHTVQIHDKILNFNLGLFLQKLYFDFLKMEKISSHIIIKLI